MKTSNAKKNAPRLIAQPLQKAEITPDRQKVYTLAQLQEQCEKKKEVHFDLDGALWAIEVRRTTPQEDALLDAIEDAVLPPLKETGKKGELVPDIGNPEYQTKKSKAAIESRALALYWCVPIFHAEKPGLTNATEIIGFIQSKLNSQILGLLHQSVRNGGVTIAQLVNFTSSSPSPES